jgi:formylglycine-generating enzyme required for sulfatase activity
MHGNVWEWVQDEWHDSDDNAPTDGSAWESEDGADRVDRGGSWYFNAEFCRSAYRSHDDPGSCSDDLGFRLLREL